MLRRIPYGRRSYLRISSDSVQSRCNRGNPLADPDTQNISPLYSGKFKSYTNQGRFTYEFARETFSME
ncbi:hypothetical protein DY000_02039146 [Brassica cretica]|uniref:Uncharacterized protein n=1 Tax=Brassica cretica TaxID=69181 RepID=A0ABQ7BD47_BRACR|nr:hypothetical protein DY000_02039146 [Brassica cretica]